MDISNLIDITLDATKINIAEVHRERFKTLNMFGKLESETEVKNAWKHYKENLIENIKKMEL